MKRLLIAVSIAVMAASMGFAQAKSETAAPGAAEALADVRRAIDKGNAQWSEGWAKGDAAMVAAIFADDGVQLAGSGKLIKGRQQIMERQKAAMQGSDPGVKVTVTTVNVWLDGDVAYETGKYKYEYTEKGKPGKDEGRYVTIWKRQKDGSWKLTMDMGVPQD
ncbi:MAG TPA: SgcJ/EcaC family oxidoreductase [Thermoanaerobaculia bacterium]|nr:SgcJ/EcaC family oxidoreductase [Thermoanaerobaculia bacterium]